MADEFESDCPPEYRPMAREVRAARLDSLPAGWPLVRNDEPDDDSPEIAAAEATTEWWGPLPAGDPGEIDPMWNDEWRLSETRYGIPHNLLAHPLLVICEPLGIIVHEHTAEIVPTWRARWRRWRQPN